MKYAMIATWRMAVEGITSSKEILEKGGTAGDAIENAIKMVEDYPFYKSVGYGGLPNEDCEVELDAAYMDGDTLDIGAVAGIKDYKNPISIARKLSKERFNCFLVGAGAEAYAHKEGFERVNMLTDRAKMHYQKRRKETIEKGLSPYDGPAWVIILEQPLKIRGAIRKYNRIEIKLGIDIVNLYLFCRPQYLLIITKNKKFTIMVSYYYFI